MECLDLTADRDMTAEMALTVSFEPPKTRKIFFFAIKKNPKRQTRVLEFDLRLVSRKVMFDGVV